MSPLVLLPRLRPVLSKRMGLALGLWGEAGIGKTWTAGQLITQTPCKCFTLHGTASIAVWVKTLPRPNKLPVWVLRICERAERGEHLDSAPLADALAGLLAAMAPVMLHLEDLHEVGAERMELITFLAQRVVRTRGVALIVTSRMPLPEPFEAVRLEALSPEDSRGLLEAEVGAQLPSEGLDWIYTHALGNPLFTLEYVRYLIRMGFLWSDGQRWHWREPLANFVPVTVEALIEQMLREVANTPMLQRTVEVRAMLGSEVGLDLWAGVAQLSGPDLSQALEHLHRHGVFKEQYFAHPLFREVALRSTSPILRQQLARRALALLEHDPQLGAQFVEQAGLEPPERLAWFQRAADAAQNQGLEIQAARFLALAAPLATGEARGSLAYKAALVLLNHDLPQAAYLAELALDSPGVTFEMVRLFARSKARLGQLPDIEALVAGLPAPLRDQVNPHALGITTCNHSSAHQEAIKIWEAHPELHAKASAEVLRAVAASAAATGRMELAQALTAQGLQGTLGAEMRAELLSIWALVIFHQGDSGQAEAILQEAIELLQGLDAPRLLSIVLVNRAAFLRLSGRYAQMTACLEQALVIRQQAGDAKAYAFAQAALAELQIEQGRYNQAEENLSAAIAILERYGPSRFLINTLSMASLLHLSQPSPIGKLLALKYAEQALTHARQSGNPRAIREVLFEASLAHTSLGNPQQGLSLAQEAQSLAEASGNAPLDNLRTLWAQGLALESLNHPEQAIGNLQAALQICREIEAPLEAHKIGLELDRLRGNLDSAREHLHWFEAQGLMNGVNMVLRYFPELAGGRLDLSRAEGKQEAGSKEHSESLSLNPEPSALRASTQNLTLEVLGPMQIRVDETPEPLRGQKRKEFLALLLEARLSGRSEAPMLELIENLYPEEPELEAQASLRNLVFSTRESLGQAVIVTTPGGYALGAVGSDAEEFLRSGDTHLWRGTYRSDAEGDADEGVWEALYHSLANQSAGLIESDPTEAARIGRILLEADPYNSQHLSLTLRALRAVNNHKTLTRLYTQARERFAEVGQTLPQDWKTYLQKSA